MTEIAAIEAGWSLDNSYTHLPKILFTPQRPTPVRSPKLVVLNNQLAASLGLNAQALSSEEGVETLAGNQVPRGALPLAQAYAGHQFGHFTMLGDGRAVLIGEQLTPSGGRFDIQLKGSGRTPYSRGGDGRAALGPMLREYIISEAMHALGIATTRSLAVVTTGELVIREKELLGAILTRVAASHLRVGTFEYVSEWGIIEDLRELADYTLKRHFSHIHPEDNRYLDLLRQVISRQAETVAKWQLVGFVHGVMNTDNMALSGETIDYGPCAFMDVYDPATVFSSIDRYGRYAFGNQPQMAAWNLARFAETLLPLLDDSQEKAVQLAQDEISQFNNLYQRNWFEGMRAKLGLFDEEPLDTELIESLLGLMQKYGADYTNTFRALTLNKVDDNVLNDSPEFAQWYELWRARLDRQRQPIEAAYQMMMTSNPTVIPRNHRVEEALEAAVRDGDYSIMQRLLDVLLLPYDHSIALDDYYTLPSLSSSQYRTFCGT